MKRGMLALLLASGCGGRGTDSAPFELGRYEVLELDFPQDDSPYANPWEEASLTGRFSGPSGKTVSVDGFYFGPKLWKARFSPTELGDWSWTLTFQSASASATRTGAFRCTPSDRPGFVRRHPANPYRLVFDDGTLFNAIGIADCVNDDDKNGNPLDNWGLDGEFRAPGVEAGWTVDMPTYMAAYGKAGAGFNLFRWGVENCGFGLAKSIAPSGNVYGVQEGLWGDQLVRALRQGGFRVWMTVFGFTPPFPNATMAEMDAIRRYLRYAVARYGAYVDIWELMNEATVPDAWTKSAATFLKSVDPYGHLLATSWERPDLDEIDLNTPHWYEKESELESDHRTLAMIDGRKSSQKPILFGEQGNRVRNWDARSAVRMRLRSWTAFFAEGILVFWNTSFAKDYYNPDAANIYLGPVERGYVRALQAFTAGVDPEVVPVTLTVPTTGVRGFGLRSSSTLLGYFHHFTDHETPVSATAILDVPANGTIAWIDPATGQTLGSASVAAGVQTVTAPAFAVDVAFRIRAP